MEREVRCFSLFRESCLNDLSPSHSLFSPPRSLSLSYTRAHGLIPDSRGTEGGRTRARSKSSSCGRKRSENVDTLTRYPTYPFTFPIRMQARRTYARRKTHKDTREAASQFCQREEIFMREILCTIKQSNFYRAD